MNRVCLTSSLERPAPRFGPTSPKPLVDFENDARTSDSLQIRSFYHQLLDEGLTRTTEGFQARILEKQN
jgi:hypothetical protein